ncbi:AAA family ATPase [Paenibacillus ferrarius]|uniref:nucleotide-binding protein n=1 Tax=Paenibacillus ferrarius TaxID=1469647 RepID=UPI003D2D29AE
MVKISLFFVDDDAVYAQRLAAYLRTSEFAGRIQLKLYSDLSLLLRELDKETYTEGILLFSESFYPELAHRTLRLSKVVLSQAIANSSRAEEKLPFLFRYQSLEQLFSHLLALYAVKQESDGFFLGRKTQVISVYASSGGSGKSILAVHLAKQLASRGKRVFYLSLENVSPASRWLSGETGQLSRLMYYLKQAPKSLGPKLQLLKSHDARFRIDYLTPDEQAGEMQQMQPEHVQKLVEAIRELDAYDTLILDLASSLHPRIVAALELSHEVIWLVLDDWNDRFKTQALSREVKLPGNVRYVMSKHRGSPVQEVEAYLPYIPEWRALASPEQLWTSDIFEQQIDVLAEKLDGRPGRPLKVEKEAMP